MLTHYVRIAEDRLEIGRGESRAQFQLQGNRWLPLWMWQGDRRMLRFRNHEWLTVGHVRPKATDWEIVENTDERVTVRFWGEDSYFGVPIECSVWVGAEAHLPGFTITTEILAQRRIEVFECFSRFETPFEYDGREEVLCVIGQNPVVYWQGKKSQVSPSERVVPVKDTVAPATDAICPTRTPICCVRLRPADQGPERCFTLIGDWKTCCFRTLSLVPTEFVGDLRAYEFLIGVLDPRCDTRIEPNVFLEAGESYRQQVSIAFSSEMPGGSLDRWFYGAFERGLRRHFPREAVVETQRLAREKKANLAEANAWLLGMIKSDEVPGLFSPQAGIVTYVEGTAAEAGNFSSALLAPWIADVGYQCYVMRRDDLGQTCDRLVAPVAAALDRAARMTWEPCPIFHEILPLLRYLRMFPNSTLQGTIREVLGRMLETSPTGSGRLPSPDFGQDVFLGEAYLLAGQLSGDKSLLEAGRACLERINAAVGDQFWRFGCWEKWGNGAGRGQISPLAYGHGILCNLLAYQQGRDERYMEMAGTFARYLASLCFAIHNDSDDLDFDTRGFANGLSPQRGKRIECSPVETSDSLRCVAYWLGFRSDNPTGFYDLLWLLSQTFCAVFPAARRQRAGFGHDGRPLTYRNEDLPTAIACRRFPFVAFENPIRQTHQSPRASVEALMNYLTFGGGLASCDNERLLVLAPRAGGYDMAERVGRLVHVYNPTEIEQTAQLAVHGLPAGRTFEVIVGNQRVATGLSGDRVAGLAIQVPPRRVVVIEIAPTRQPTNF